MTQWEAIRTRFYSGIDSPNGFYGCVNKEGEWFDSSLSFELAVHWCCCSAGCMSMTSEQELAWMRDEGIKRGYSVIHSSLLEKMANAGLIT